MNYALTKPGQESRKTSVLPALKKLASLMIDDKGKLILAFIAIIINSALNLTAPILIGHAVDTYLVTKQYDGVLKYSGLLLLIYLGALVMSYLQTKLMGMVGQRMLFNLRHAIFTKLQQLPVAFFNQNKIGDLISRINNDTDKLNQFFSQSLMQFVGSIFIMVGSGISILLIRPRLALAALAPALGLLIFTRVISPWVKRKNALNLQSVGGMSAEIQESLNNFRVIVAFNRRDYFRNKFNEANDVQYATAIKSGIANNIFTPVYGLCSNIAQLIVLAYGINLIMIGDFTLGLLISFLTYMTRFYDPLRQLASLWANFQVALAGWDRISDILALESDLVVVRPGPWAEKPESTSSSVMSFVNVSFHYPDGKDVLKHITFNLEPGKTYALVGPTGGGKTTTASLMARLYDPTDGMVMLHGRDIRGYRSEERAQKIGFILQEPFLFTGTVRDNIIYGNPAYREHSTEQLAAVLKESGLEILLARFEKGLDTPVLASGDTISLGQKQLIAFIRAVLRKPDILILDEATANIDTVTEQLLEEILKQLPKTTTRVIIAHRLNTIENADEIFFINSGEVTLAGSMEHAVDMLLHGKRES